MIEPEAGDQLGGLRGVFEPRRLPGDFGNKTGFAPQASGDGARGALGGLTVRRANREDQLPRIGEILLENFQPLHCGRAAGQQIQNLDVETQARHAEAERDQQQEAQPVTRGFYRNPEFTVGNERKHRLRESE